MNQAVVKTRASDAAPVRGNRPEPGSELIRLESVSKRFGELVVLDNVDLQLRAGQTTVVIGASGTGKSVLLKHIVALLQPDSGRVIFDGTDLGSLSEPELAPIRRRFGFLFQGGALFDSMTAGANVAFPLIESGCDARQAAEIAREKLDMVGLGHVFDQMPGQLSGGQKKRVALARAIALDVDVILYDEPTTGLDPIRSDVISRLIVKLQRELAVTSIVVTHDMRSAYTVADRIIMLADGGFIADGTCEQIRNSQDPRVRDFIEGRSDAE